MPRRTLISIAKSLLKTQKKQSKLERAIKKELRELTKENKKLSKAIQKIPFGFPYKDMRKEIIQRKNEIMEQIQELQKALNTYLREEKVEDRYTQRLLKQVHNGRR